MFFGEICDANHLFFSKLLLLRKITMQDRLPNSKKIAVYIHEVWVSNLKDVNLILFKGVT